MSDSIGRIELLTEVKNKLTVDSCWHVKLPGSDTVVTAWVKDLTASTIVLELSWYSMATRYYLPDITFLEPVSIEPPKLNTIYHEIKWSKP